MKRTISLMFIWDFIQSSSENLQVLASELDAIILRNSHKFNIATKLAKYNFARAI